MLITIKKAVIAIILLSVVILSANIIRAKAVNSNQYYEIDFTYINVIKGNNYIEEAVLLRDKRWLDSNGIHKSGDTLVLNIPEFGVVNAKATAKSVEVSHANPTRSYTKHQSMVTGTFKHYSTDVREYTLQDIKTGIIQTIEVTPNHAFYVQNRTTFNKALKRNSHFIEIQYITPLDHMVNEAGNIVALVCDKRNITSGNKTSNCYKQLVHNNMPLTVYNLEIFKQHQYMVVSNKSIKENISNSSDTHTMRTFYNKKSELNIVSNNAILVHNICGNNVEQRVPIEALEMPNNSDEAIQLVNRTQYSYIIERNGITYHMRQGVFFRGDGRDINTLFANYATLDPLEANTNINIASGRDGTITGGHGVSTTTDFRDAVFFMERSRGNDPSILLIDGRNFNEAYDVDANTIEAGNSVYPESLQEVNVVNTIYSNNIMGRLVKTENTFQHNRFYSRPIYIFERNPFYIANYIPHTLR
ncbi:hypothetical protein ACFX5K_03280 [Rickettsiales bacterium LUAb2]